MDDLQEARAEYAAMSPEEQEYSREIVAIVVQHNETVSEGIDAIEADFTKTFSQYTPSSGREAYRQGYTQALNDVRRVLASMSKVAVKVVSE